ncbi:hypothetical protein EDD86DRAFT_202663 [Gorgonomyces haynaldii]|nr:hypothetical protein EDD86DRAFT_202663 [Gorgonomyces haynaldii]
MRYFNLMGGDYGAKAANISINTSQKYMRIVPQKGEPDLSESDTHPGAPIATNYWYVKFDLKACFDLSPYTAIQFDLVAPAGSDMYFTLTQHLSDCVTRVIDSVYTTLTKYVKPDGTKKTVTIPISDFATNLVGKPFDFVHLKDFTVVNLAPVGADLRLSQFLLKGNCPPGTPTQTGNLPLPVSATANVAPTGVTSTAASATAAPSATGSTKNGASAASSILGFIPFIALL